MATRIRVKRGTASQITGYTGTHYVGELAYATDTEAFYVSNGTAFIPVGGSSETPTLQSVTDAGSTTTNAISAGTITANNELHLVNSQMRIFRSSDDMRIRTGNSDRMTITSTGNVGIGTTSPTEKLEVSGNVKVSNGSDNISIIPNNSNGSISTTSQAVQGAIISAVSDGLTFSSRNIYGGVNVGSFNNAGTVTLGAFAYGNVNYQTAHNSFAHTWYGSRASDPWMTLNNSGLGIGTTSPDAKLHIKGSFGNNTFKVKPNSDHTIIEAGQEFRIATTNSGDIKFQPGGVIGMFISGTNRNVGIGTTAPSKKLHVAANDGDGIHLSHGASNAFYIERSGSDNTIIKQLRNYTSVISLSTLADAGTYDSSALNIVGQGVGAKSYVGIGTTSPSEKLQVLNSVMIGERGFTSFSDGRLRVASTTDYGEIGFSSKYDNFPAGIRSYAVDALYERDLRFYTKDTISAADGELRMIINGSGNVGIGTTAPQQKLHVDGTIRIGADVDLIRYAGTLRTPQNFVLGSANLEGANLTINAGSTQNAIGVRRPPSGTTSILKVRDYSTQDVYVDIDSDGNAYFDGNVGIGTTAPNSKLEVEGTAMRQFRLKQAGGPSSNTDTSGREGDFAYDDQYLYIKTGNGWGRVALDFAF